jgi:hypothetical protein
VARCENAAVLKPAHSPVADGPGIAIYGLAARAQSPPPEDVEYSRWLAPAAALAAIGIGLALQISGGLLNDAALLCIALAFVVVVGAAVTPRPVRFAHLDARIVPPLALAGLFVQTGLLYTSTPGMYLRLEQGSLVPFYWALTALAAVGGSVVWGIPRWARPMHIGALVTAHFAIGLWMIHYSPDPAIDVHMFHRYSIAALRSGVDPYAITFPDIYNNAQFYGPGLSLNGRLQFGFPYLPLSLLAVLPGQLIGKDPRYAQLVAIELAAILMALSRFDGFGMIAAALYLTMPRTFFVLEQSWTEPILVLGLAAVVFAACRHSRAVPWLFGAFIALKQYLVFALLAAPLLVPSPRDRRQLLTLLTKAAIVGVAVTLPFFLWNPAAFWRSVVTLQFHQPFRTDALSVLSWWAARGHDQPPALIAFLAAGIASSLALWRLPRTPAGFSAAIAITFFAFFVFNKQAFSNYYFFVIGALYATLAAWRAPETIQ